MKRPISGKYLGGELYMVAPIVQYIHTTLKCIIPSDASPGLVHFRNFFSRLFPISTESRSSRVFNTQVSNIKTLTAKVGCATTLARNHSNISFIGILKIILFSISQLELGVGNIQMQN